MTIEQQARLLLGGHHDADSHGEGRTVGELLLDGSLVVPLQPIALPTNDVLVGTVEFATLALAVVLPAVNLLDHDGAVT